MKIVIDTNVFISAVFFGGPPLRLLDSVFSGKNDAFASEEIWEEYIEIIDRLYRKYQPKYKDALVRKLFDILHFVEVRSHVDICRDPDDNKFIDCALDGKCLYIVSGDDDLLSIKDYEGISIITVADFLDRFVSDN